MIYRDELTGLANRNAFIEACESSLMKAGPEYRIALHVIHILNLKDLVIEDGLHVAEGALKVVAGRLYGVFQADRVFARLESDILGLLQMDVAHDGHALYTARRIFETLAAPLDIFDKTIVLHSNIGIAICPDHGRDFEHLYNKARIALQRAETGETGKSRIYQE